MPYQTHLARMLRNRSTDGERLLWHRLRSRQIAGAKFRRQVPLGDYIVDFASFSPRIVIEVDGGQHALPIERSRDLTRDAWLKEQGYVVLRFWNADVLENLDGVVSQIYETVARLVAD